MKIPRTIHQIWTGSPISEPQSSWSKAWAALNPGWKLALWEEGADNTLVCGSEVLTTTLGDVLDFCKKEYPHLWGLRKCVWRLELLLKYGGLYLDMDVEPLKPLGSILDDSEAVITPMWIYPLTHALSFMASTPGHKWIGEIHHGMTPTSLIRMNRLVTDITCSYPNVKTLDRKLIVQLPGWTRAVMRGAKPGPEAIAVHHYLTQQP